MQPSHYSESKIIAIFKQQKSGMKVHAAKNAIEIYNSKRLHLSLGYQTPNMVFENVAEFIVYPVAIF